mmetsp:Transcript_18379/g.31413  ORF Transcript_18379/g.31413 Transcript_18379/m.31413 type:complete len:103 (-) Transcript_18379:1091-1399(-)
MQPKFNMGPPSAQNPWGNVIPRNYFCKYTFNLDWDQVYKLNIQRFNQQATQESIDIKLIGVSSTSSASLPSELEDSSVIRGNEKSYYIQNSYLMPKQSIQTR